MSSIRSAQNLQTLRRRNRPRRWPPCLSPGAVPLPLPPGPLGFLPPNGIVIPLLRFQVRAVVGHVGVVVVVVLRPLAGLPIGRQAAGDPAAARSVGPLGARPIRNLLPLVD